MIDRVEFFKTLAELRTDEVVIGTMMAKFWLPGLCPHPLNLRTSAAMGYTSSVALGLAIGSPERKVVVLDGDGSLLMNLGTLVTIAERSPANLIHIVLENGLYELPGRVKLPAADKISLCGFARAAGWTKVYEFDEAGPLREHLGKILREPGPAFVDLKIAPGPRGPAPGTSELDMIRGLEKALQGQC